MAEEVSWEISGEPSGRVIGHVCEYCRHLFEVDECERGALHECPVCGEMCDIPLEDPPSLPEPEPISIYRRPLSKFDRWCVLTITPAALIWLVVYEPSWHALITTIHWAVYGVAYDSVFTEELRKGTPRSQIEKKAFLTAISLMLLFILVESFMTTGSIVRSSSSLAGRTSGIVCGWFLAMFVVRRLNGLPWIFTEPVESKGGSDSPLNGVGRDIE